MRCLMETAPLRSYREEFAKRAEWRREDERRLDQIKMKEEQDKKKEREREADQDAILDTMMVVLVTETEIADFNVKLDAYDTATVEALMENEEALAKVREDIRIMLDKAYVLPDGRRVFKTEDGTRVFDEHGVEVENIDPNEIEDERPRWERFSERLEAHENLIEERKGLVEFQEQLDEVREEANEDGLTKAELEELEKRLEENAPDAVKAKMAEDGPEQDAEVAAAPKPETTFRPAGKLDMPAL